MYVAMEKKEYFFTLMFCTNIAIFLYDRLAIY